MNYHKDKLKTILDTVASKKKKEKKPPKTLGINLTKEVKDLYSEKLRH